MVQSKSDIFKEKIREILDLNCEIINYGARGQAIKIQLCNLEAELFDLIPEEADGAVFFERFRGGGSQLFCVEFRPDRATGERILFTHMTKPEDFV